MKKQIILVIILGSFLGILLGNFIFKNYQGTNYLESDGNIFYLQYGVYTSKEAAEVNSKKIIKEHFIKELDNKYYVYLGVTTDYDRAVKLQKELEQENIHIYIRSDYVENSETLEKLKEYEKEINDENIQSVMKEIFENSELNL